MVKLNEDATRILNAAAEQFAQIDQQHTAMKAALKQLMRSYGLDDTKQYKPGAKPGEYIEVTQDG